MRFVEVMISMESVRRLSTLSHYSQCRHSAEEGWEEKIPAATSGPSTGMMVGGKTWNMSNCNFSIPRNTNISLHNHYTDRHKVMFHDSAAVTSPGIMSNMRSQGQKNYILCGI